MDKGKIKGIDYTQYSTINVEPIRSKLGEKYIAQRKDDVIGAIDETMPDAAKYFDQGYSGILQPYLRIIKKVIEENANMNRLKETTMMIKILRMAYTEETTQRYKHSLVVSGTAKRLARELGLNVDIVDIMARYHDIGHTFYGHDGEWMLSEYLGSQGLGGLVHNAEGTRRLLFREQIYDKIIERIVKEEPNIKKWKLKIIRDNLWKIFDGILTHNGELASKKFVPQIEKTEEDFLKELGLCYTNTKDKVDRQIFPGTIEGCLLRFSDIISYVGMDLLDGRREGLITGIDSKYEEVLQEFGIPKEHIEKIKRNDELFKQRKINARDKEELKVIEDEEKEMVNRDYGLIESVVREAIIQDILANSSKKRIAMSQRMADLTYEGLRKQNEDQIVSKVTKRTERGAFPLGIENIINKGTEILLQEGIIDSLNNGNTSKIEEIVEQTKEKYIFSSEEYKEYKRILDFIAETNDLDYEFTRQIAKIQYDNAPKGKKEKLSLDKVTAMLMVSQFLASLKDAEFAKFLYDTGNLTTKQYRDLWKKFKDTENPAEKSIYLSNQDALRREERAAEAEEYGIEDEL